MTAGPLSTLCTGLCSPHGSTSQPAATRRCDCGRRTRVPLVGDAVGAWVPALKLVRHPRVGAPVLQPCVGVVRVPQAWAKWREIVSRSWNKSKGCRAYRHRTVHSFPLRGHVHGLSASKEHDTADRQPSTLLLPPRVGKADRPCRAVSQVHAALTQRNVNQRTVLNALRMRTQVGGNQNRLYSVTAELYPWTRNACLKEAPQ